MYKNNDEKDIRGGIPTSMNLDLGDWAFRPQEDIFNQTNNMTIEALEKELDKQDIRMDIDQRRMDFT